MSLSPWPQGDLAPTWSISLSTDSNGVVDLTGLSASALSLLIVNDDIEDVTAAQQSGAGSFAITQARPAIVSYAPASADVATPGNFSLWVIVDFGTSSQSFGPYAWQVVPKITPPTGGLP